MSVDTLPGLATWFSAQNTVRQSLDGEHFYCSAEYAAEVTGQLMRDLKTTDALAKVDELFFWSKDRQFATDLIVLGGTLLSCALDQNRTTTQYSKPATAISDLFFNTKMDSPLFIETLFDRKLNHARSV